MLMDSTPKKLRWMPPALKKHTKSQLPYAQTCKLATEVLGAMKQNCCFPANGSSACLEDEE